MRFFVCKNRPNGLASTNRMHWRKFALPRWRMLAGMRRSNSVQCNRFTAILRIQWRNSITLDLITKGMWKTIWIYCTNASRKLDVVSCLNLTCNLFVNISAIRSTSTALHHTVVQLNRESLSVVFQKQNRARNPNTDWRQESFLPSWSITTKNPRQLSRPWNGNSSNWIQLFDSVVSATDYLLFYRFINFLKNYSSDSIDIAFSSERSIQDAIEELSQTEASTVIISYTVMFLYVSIALGKFTSFRTLLVCSRFDSFKRSTRSTSFHYGSHGLSF